MKIEVRRRYDAICRGVLFGIAALSPNSLLATEAIPLLLAETEQGQSDVSLFLVSEKLDGVRAYWDGKVLRTRNGNTINAPGWFTEGFPDRVLDGELWIGRGEFDTLSGAVRRQTPDETEWRKTRYLVFELPNAAGTFRERNDLLKREVESANVAWLKVVEQWEITDRKALDLKLAEILKLGGEGLMLHRADATYTTGRSDVLLKMKLWRDAEAKVIGHQPGKGKYAGMLGALRVQTADGVEFMLGTGFNEAERKNPPPVGSTVTYRYRELTKRGVPRFASFYRVREL